MPRSRAPSLLIVTPSLADANNGNWRTAARWARLLAAHYHVIVQAANATSAATSAPPATGPGRDAGVLIALHARHSHAAIAGRRNAFPEWPIVVALTGTDLYRDLPAGNAQAALSLQMEDRLIVLQEDAPRHLPAALSARTDVVFQSARSLIPWPRKQQDRLHCVLVAHLRDEKDPATAFAAWRLLPHDVPATLTIIGAALDPALGLAARDLAASDPRVQWLGPRTHAWTRQAIKRAHLLLVPSRMEGGANVVVEAVTAGTSVLGSRMSGNVGMLGIDYPGFFEVGHAEALATLVARAAADHDFRDELAAACALRASLFTPQAEARALRGAIAAALATRGVRIAV